MFKNKIKEKLYNNIPQFGTFISSNAPDTVEICGLLGFDFAVLDMEHGYISPETLTERFVRGEESRTNEGNGLGLSIAKDLCKLQGGELIINIDGDLFKATVKLPK